MERRLQNRLPGLPQEGLKLLAAGTMLLDHVGYLLCADALWMRAAGRLAFPLYAFLLVEGFYHTGNYVKYLGRLLLCALLSELPYDLALWGGVTPEHQNVLVTLALGLLCLWLLEQARGLRRPALRVLGSAGAIWAASVMAEGVSSDYGALGIWYVALFYFTYDLPRWGFFPRAAGLALLSAAYMRSFQDLQLLSAGAAAVLLCYNGRRATGSRAVQTGFYLFYPVHLLVLWGICRFLK